MLPLSELADEPAGRLHSVLGLFRDLDSNGSVTQMWGKIAPLVATGGDAISVRSEAASLLRDVERAVYSLPQRRHRASALLRDRPQWARPIFGISFNDTAAYSPNDLIADSALDSLSTLSSLLSLAGPEHRPKGSDEELVRVLEEVYDQLGQLRIDIENATDIPEVARIRMLGPISIALEKITYVRIRGFSHLLGTVQVTAFEVGVVVAEQASEEPSAIERFNNWLEVFRQVIRKVEEVVLPPAVGIATGISSKNLELGLGATLATRISLENLKIRKEIESGSNGEAGLNSDQLS
ncbi:Hypothetical protein AJAP_41295 [Amycolatopsis japonica]|uniref:Uncharacterized protein n=1 Tax=Amycolatopsis japonica TaxID=208439 RepID=A0A075V974_9PSEU|nr:hypothetical protein [Amycolatopsis japonica]AIG81034.1 Hypothetical protein AJAP_41295 [Amycolatopsis japonica]